MLTIRLQRKGRRNQPFFKIVVTEEKKSSTGGRFVEELGFYNPLTKERSVNGERAKYWMSVGAKPSDTMYNMLISENVIEGTKIPKHKKSKKEKPAEKATAPAEEPKEQETPAPQEPAEAPKEEEPVQETKPEEAPTPGEQKEEPKPEKQDEKKEPPASS